MIQAIIEEINDIAKEKAMNAKNPPILNAGISSQYDENPAKLKDTILNPSAIKVTRYSVRAYVTHLNKLNVMRLIGKSNIFIIGLITRLVMVSVAPAKIMVLTPLANIKP